jgi:3-isopropylmalate/(R)-2-methylmalate dehydratase small subunit
LTDLIKGRVWCFGDDINTELILPTPGLSLARADRVPLIFSANRPGWVESVTKGDILVAGSNFGMGSGRPASQALKDLGLGCLVAESLNGLFFRNCVNFAFPALEVPGVRSAFNEGDEAEVDLRSATVVNLTTGTRLQGSPWPEFGLAALAAGGLVEKLDAAGLLYLRAGSLR